MILLAFALFAFWLQRKATARKFRHQISGKGDTGTPSRRFGRRGAPRLGVGAVARALTVVLYGMSIFGAFVRSVGTRSHLHAGPFRRGLLD